LGKTRGLICKAEEEKEGELEEMVSARVWLTWGKEEILGKLKKKKHFGKSARR
jgi:hypothetical protein